MIIIWLVICFAWLLYETDWMRVRLPRCSVATKYQEHYVSPQAERIMRIRRGELKRCPKCNEYKEHLQIRMDYTHAGNSHCSFTACDKCRVKIRAEIEASQKPTKPHEANPISHYPIVSMGLLSTCQEWYAKVNRHEGFEPSIEVSYNGNSILSVNGQYKRGIIKDAVNKCYIYRQGKLKVTPY